MDLNGNTLKTVYIVIKGLYTINEDRLYYLKENEDEEEWELFVEKF
jgi:hypothetical protein